MTRRALHWAPILAAGVLVLAACGDITVAGDVPAGCCSEDEQCEDGARCLRPSTATYGVCAATPGEGRCFDDGDCEGGDLCADAVVCACGAECEPSPGTCEGSDGCCTSDDDCGDDQVCRGGDPDGGGCAPAPDIGECYTDEDCGPGIVCEGAVICGCAEKCLITLGECNVSRDCCMLDTDCGPDRICRGRNALGDDGTCVPLLGEGQCFELDDCGPDTFCEGGSVCGCTEECAIAMGSCEPVGPACCAGDSECTGDQVCALPSTMTDGRCVAPAAEGECWSSSECAPSESCINMMTCGCLPCQMPEMPGVCLEESGCCGGDTDCPPGWVCRGQNENEGAGACAPGPPPGTCYGPVDCDGAACIEGLECGCLVDCVSMLGFCEGAAPCCSWDTPCPEDQVCAGLDENAPSTVLGQCEPLVAGACWTDAECGRGWHCEGASHCGCACEVEPTPGQCVEDEPRRCCGADTECMRGEVCVGDRTLQQGICLPAPPERACYEPRDCPNAIGCKNSVVCQCRDTDCEPVMGTCP